MSKENKEPAYFSVDAEASGPIPSLYNMLSVGAVMVRDRSKRFYMELKPDTARYDKEALGVTGFSMERLMETGIESAEAMGNFADWIVRTAEGRRAVLVSFGTFDWMFVQDYLGRHGGRFVFGINGLDMKSFAFGLLDDIPNWNESSGKRVMDLIGIVRDPQEKQHNALHDAMLQARMFERLLEIKNGRGKRVAT